MLPSTATPLSPPWPLCAADLDYDAVAKPVAEFVRAHHAQLPWLEPALPTFLALGFLFWYRKELRDRLALDSLFNFLQYRLWKRPHPRSTSFSVVIAHLVNDTADRENEILIERELREIPGVQAIRCGRTINVEAYSDGHAQARSLLKKFNADAMLWGERITRDGASELRLCWTLHGNNGNDLTAKRYGRRAADDINLPGIFHDDVGSVLSMLVLTAGSELLKLHGSYFADRLRPFVERVQALLSRGRRDGLAWGIVYFMLGNALLYIGAQEARNDDLLRAVANYDEALARINEQESANLRAAVLYEKGNALSKLGERESTVSHLQQAVITYRLALRLHSANDIVERASIQQCLAQAYYKLGLRQAGTQRLDRALRLCQEYTRLGAGTISPFVWAALQSTIGDISVALAQRHSDPELLERSIVAYSAALQHRTRTVAPLEWAESTNNLGTALAILGDMRDDGALLEKARDKFSEALFEYRPDRVPLEYASTMNNLGNVYLSLAKLQNTTEYILEGVATYRKSLAQYNREQASVQWARAQRNLGLALAAAGEHEPQQSYLADAVIAYRNALLEQTPKSAPIEYYTTQYQLGQVLQLIGARDSSGRHFREALVAYAEALKNPSPPDAFLSAAQHALGYVYQMLGQMDQDVELLRLAAQAYLVAIPVSTDSAKERTLANLGRTLQYIGEATADIDSLRAAALAYRESLQLDTPQTPPDRVAAKEHFLEVTLAAISALGGSKRNEVG